MTLKGIQDKIIADFARFSDWLEKYEYLISLGNKHDGLSKEFKTDEYALPGCQSQLWIRAEGKDGKIHFSADSDSKITRGIIALLFQVLNGQTPETVSNADLYFLDKIGLTSNLSPTRANGLATIVKRLKAIGRHFA